jgi:DNA-binding PadR family transcriptional regulator
MAALLDSDMIMSYRIHIAIYREKSFECMNQNERSASQMRKDGPNRRFDRQYGHGDTRRFAHGRYGHTDDEFFEGRAHGRRERMERGAMRYIILDALRDGPKHGYEIIRWLDEKTHGYYAPSPGAVYPTLQMLGDLGFVRADRNDERRVYDLTDTGRSELDAHADTVQYFWARFTGQPHPGLLQPEMGFVQDELNELTRTVWGGTRAAMVHGDDGALRNVRSAIERCKNEVREIIARSVSTASSAAVEP